MGWSSTITDTAGEDEEEPENWLWPTLGRSSSSDPGQRVSVWTDGGVSPAVNREY